VLQHARAIACEAAVLPAFLGLVHVEEPAKQQVVVQLLRELTLTCALYRVPSRIVASSKRSGGIDSRPPCAYTPQMLATTFAEPRLPASQSAELDAASARSPPVTEVSASTFASSPGRACLDPIIQMSLARDLEGSAARRPKAEPRIPASLIGHLLSVFANREIAHRARFIPAVLATSCHS
jgi:hypothetical protein